VKWGAIGNLLGETESLGGHFMITFVRRFVPIRADEIRTKICGSGIVRSFVFSSF